MDMANTTFPITNAESTPDIGYSTQKEESPLELFDDDSDSEEFDDEEFSEDGYEADDPQAETDED